MVPFCGLRFAAVDGFLRMVIKGLRPMPPTPKIKTNKKLQQYHKFNKTMKNHQQLIELAILNKSDIRFGISVFFYIGKIGYGMIFDDFDMFLFINLIRNSSLKSKFFGRDEI